MLGPVEMESRPAMRTRSSSTNYRAIRGELQRRGRPKPYAAKGDLWQWDLHIVILPGGEKCGGLRHDRRRFRLFQRLRSREQRLAWIERTTVPLGTRECGAETQRMMHMRNTAGAGNRKKGIVERKQRQQHAHRSPAHVCAGARAILECRRHR